MKLQLIDQLNALGESANNAIDYLNDGGCAVYAANVASALDQIGVEVWGVVSGGHSCDPQLNINSIKEQNENLETLLDWNNNGICFGHVLVQFFHDGKIWTHDSNNTTHKVLKNDTSFGGNLYNGYLTVDDMVDLAKQSRGWNPMFNRTKYIPTVKLLVDKFLSKDFCYI